MKTILLVIMFCSAAALVYMLGITQLRDAGTDGMLMRPAIKAYEDMLDVIAEVQTLDDMEQYVDPIYFGTYLDIYAGRERSLGVYKQWHDLTAMEYIKIISDNGGVVRFNYIGTSKAVVQRELESAGARAGMQPEGLIECEVQMEKAKNKTAPQHWLLSMQLCDIIPEAYALNSEQQKQARNQKLVSYYKLRASRED